MLLTLTALALAICTTFLVLTGLPMVLRDTADVLGRAMGQGRSRVRMVAFLSLWLLLFWLSVG